VFNRAKKTTARSSAAITDLSQATEAVQESIKRAEADLAEQRARLAESLKLRETVRALAATL